VGSNKQGDALISSPSSDVYAEISAALKSNTGALGKVARAMADGVTSPTVMAALGAGANSGHAGNLARVISYIQDGVAPTAPSRAAVAGRSIGGLLRDNPALSIEAVRYLQALRNQVDSVEKNDEARAGEESQLQEASEELTQTVEKLGGVYVYTFPTYLMVPAKVDPERFWLKIGQTGRVVEKRVMDQLRSTAMPEDPVILRVYTDKQEDSGSAQVDYAALEKKFHQLLMSAGHSKTTSRAGGSEWFATTVEFLDQIALTLELAIEKRELE
jgi:T5orf172 domain